MHPDLLNILNNTPSAITNKQLDRYLNGDLSDAEQQAFEAAIAASTMDTDALEGLELVANKAHLSKIEAEISQRLREKLPQKKQFRKQKKVEISPLLIGLVPAEP